MNTIVNDRGESVVAVGAPGSTARLRVQYPNLIEELRRCDEETARVLFAAHKLTDQEQAILLNLSALSVNASIERDYKFLTCNVRKLRSDLKPSVTAALVALGHAPETVVSFLTENWT